MCVELCRQILFSSRGLPKNDMKSSDKTQITVIPEPDPQEPLHIVLANEAQVDVSLVCTIHQPSLHASLDSKCRWITWTRRSLWPKRYCSKDTRKQMTCSVRCSESIMWATFHRRWLECPSEWTASPSWIFSKFICLILFLCTVIFQRTKISDLQGLKNGWCTSISLGINITKLLIMYHCWRYYPNPSTWISHLIMLIANHNTL